MPLNQIVLSYKPPKRMAYATFTKLGFFKFACGLQQRYVISKCDHFSWVFIFFKLPDIRCRIKQLMWKLNISNQLVCDLMSLCRDIFRRLFYLFWRISLELSNITDIVGVLKDLPDLSVARSLLMPMVISPGDLY